MLSTVQMGRASWAGLKHIKKTRHEASDYAWAEALSRWAAWRGPIKKQKIYSLEFEKVALVITSPVRNLRLSVLQA